MSTSIRNIHKSSKIGLSQRLGEPYFYETSNISYASSHGFKRVIYLGSNTSFNVVSVCNANGIDYHTLTEANFLIDGTPSLTSASSGSAYLDDDDIMCRISVGSTKTYNQSTGVLTASINVSGDGGYWHEYSMFYNPMVSVNRAFEVTAYLIY